VTSVLLLSRYDRLGASSRLRFFDFVPALRAAGFTVTAVPFLDDEYLRGLYAGKSPEPRAIAAAYLRRAATLWRAGRHDLVWLEKEALPWLPAGLERWLLGHAPYVMDIDDAWFHRYGLHRNPVVRRALGSKLERLAGNARLVLAGSPYLVDWARAAGAPAVSLLPTVVDLDRYPPPRPLAVAEPLTIGWMGTPSNRRHLDLVAGALSRLGALCGRSLRLQVVGVADVQIPGIEVVCTPWREESEVEDLAGFAIGVMPLPDAPWERGKCGYKLIQYMAAGRPVVASPVGVNVELVRNGVNGFLAADEQAWVEALLRLVGDADLRSRLGAAGRRLVEESYSLQAVAPRLAGALSGAGRRDSS
jgi:glycosyltransferase involved in cell wall biosynthesis